MPTWLFELLRELKSGRDAALGQSMGPGREWLVWGRRPVGSLWLGGNNLELERLLGELPPGGAVVTGRAGQPVLWEKLDPRRNSGAVWRGVAQILERPASETGQVWLFTSIPSGPSGAWFQAIRHLIISSDPSARARAGPTASGRWQTLDLIYPPPSPGRLIIIGLNRLARAVADLARKCGLNVVIVGPASLLNAKNWKGFHLCPLRDWHELAGLGPGARLAFRKQDFYLITAPEAAFMKSALTPFTPARHLQLITARETAGCSESALNQTAVQLVAELIGPPGSNC